MKQFLAFQSGWSAGSDLPNPFLDVKQGAFYYYPVLWAANNGITRGTSATTFNPSGDCTRGQIVTFLYRYNNQQGDVFP